MLSANEPVINFGRFCQRSGTRLDKESRWRPRRLGLARTLPFLRKTSTLIADFLSQNKSNVLSEIYLTLFETKQFIYLSLQVQNDDASRRNVKVFVQRDYSRGTACRFQTKFPPELEGKVRVVDRLAPFVNEEKFGVFASSRLKRVCLPLWDRLNLSFICNFWSQIAWNSTRR